MTNIYPGKETQQIEHGAFATKKQGAKVHHEMYQCIIRHQSVSWIDLDQVSFVNSICTIRGGTHVTHVSDQIVEVRLGLVDGWSGMFLGFQSILYFVTR